MALPFEYQTQGPVYGLFGQYWSVFLMAVVSIGTFLVFFQPFLHGGAYFLYSVQRLFFMQTCHLHCVFPSKVGKSHPAIKALRVQSSTKTRIFP